MGLVRQSTSRHRWILSVASVLFASQSSSGQTIINIPPSPAPASVGADTVVNVLPGGLLQAHNGVVATNGAIVNVQGGRVGDLTLRTGAVANVESGGIHGRFWAEDAGQVNHEGGRTYSVFLFTSGIANIFGGAIESIGAVSSSALTLHGVNFAVDGVQVAGLEQAGDEVSINLPAGATLTATLSDGTPFGHFQNACCQATIVDDGVLNLRRSADPQPLLPGIIQVSAESMLPFAGDGQNVVVNPGGRLQELFRAGPGSVIELNGGRIDPALHAIGANVIVNSGHVARRFNAFDDATLTLRGGTLEGDARFYYGSTLNVEGGEAGGGIWIRDGATLNVSGGTLYETFGFRGSEINLTGGVLRNIGSEGQVNIRGGTIPDRIDITNTGVIDFAGGRHTDFMSVRAGGQMIVRGSEIRLNGLPAPGLDQPGNSILVNLADGTVLSGVYPDGTPFVFSGDQEDVQSAIRVIAEPVPAAAPTTFQIPVDPVPVGVRAGQTLILNDGGSLPANFTAAHGSTVIIHGGNVAANFEAVGANLDVRGGQLSTIDAFPGTSIAFRGTSRWDSLQVFAGATAHVSEQSVGGTLHAHRGAAVNISGGQMQGNIHVDDADLIVSNGQLQGLTLTHFADATVSGGTFTGGIDVLSGARLHMTGGSAAGISASIGDSDLIGIATTTARVEGGGVGRLVVHTHSEVDVVHGNVTESDNLGGKTRFYGGALGDSHEWIQGSVELHGYDFQVNGVPVSGLDAVGNSRILNYVAGTTITGTFSDGTPFNLAPNDNFQSLFITNGVLRLVRSGMPALPGTIHVPTDPAPYGASAGQTVLLHEGGALGKNFLAGHDSTVQIHAGTVGDNFEAERSQVTIAGGTIGNRMDVFNGAEVTVTGGVIGEEIEIHPGGILNLHNGEIARLGKAVGGTLNMTGGSLGSSFTATQGSTVDISGGQVSSEFLAESGSTVNVSGGIIGTSFRAGNGSEMHISGGQLRDLRALAGSNVTISGGNVDDVDILSGSSALITGGAFGDNFGVNSTADATLTGLDFEIDGTPIAGLDVPGSQLTFTLAANQLFTGTLADGTPFAFRSSEGDGISAIKLVRSADLPPGPGSIQVPTDAAPNGVRAGQHLTLLNGGSLPENFSAGRGSTVDILGGTVGKNFEAVAAVVNIHGGQVGNNFDAFAGSQVNVLGGSVGTDLDAYAQSNVTVDGGVVARIDALSGAAISMAGGQIINLQATNGSHTVWTGGTIGLLNVSGANSTIAMHGVEFQLNGVPIAGLQNEGDSLQFNLPASSFLTATLADGTPVLLNSSLNSPAGNAQIATGSLTLVRSAEPGMPGPAFQQLSDSNAPFAIGDGQTLEVLPGGQLAGNFVAGPGSQLLIQGGSAGNGLKAFGGEVVVAAGSVGQNFVGLQGLELTIDGGTIGSGFSLYAGAHAMISGGVLPANFLVDPGAEVDIYGKSFLLNNQPLAGLEQPGDSLLLSARGGQTLNVVLADGSLLEWRLTSPISPRLPFGFSDQAILRLHLVPEPIAVGLLFQVLGLMLLGVRQRGKSISTSGQYSR